MRKQYSAATNHSSPKLPKSGVLSSRDAQNFRTLMKLYDHRQFRKALKMSDTILKKSIDHGETMSMRGLIFSNMAGKKEEGYECAKKGIKLDITSHMCWHIMGLIYRQDRDYGEAAKCFRHALRLESSNLQILKDLSFLQIHQRLLDGFLETRNKILQMKPNFRLHWMPLAFAHHMCGRIESALKILTLVEENFPPPSAGGGTALTDINEESELYLYKASIMEEGGQLEECIAFLSKKSQYIRDTVSLCQIQGRTLVGLRNFDEARDSYLNLLEVLPEHEDVALLCMALNSTVRHLFLFPTIDRQSDVTEHLADSDMTSRNENAETQQPFPFKDSDLPNDHCLTPSYPQKLSAPGDNATDCCAATELSPKILSNGGSKRIGWLTPIKHGYMKNPLRRYLPPRLGSENNVDIRQSDVVGKVLSENGGAEVEAATKGESLCKFDDSPVPREMFGWRKRKKFKLLPFAPIRKTTQLEVDTLHAAWNELRNRFPESRVVRRLLLYFVKGETLRHHLDHILQPLLETFTASAFELLKPLYFSNDNILVIETLLTSYCKDSGTPQRDTANHMSNEQHCGNSFGDEISAVQAVNSGGRKPMRQAAAWLLMSQHLDYIGKHEEALEYIDKAIDHTPTMLELYVFKGSVTKHLGDHKTESDLLEEARNLDLADRFVNVQSIKALLRAFKVDEAIAVSRLFSHQSEGDGRHDMQCMWLENYLGKTYAQMGLLSESLARYKKVLKYFSDFKEDQFDFHQYSLRRCTYRTYVEFLRLQDVLFSHRFYRAAARGAIRVYLRRFDERIKKGGDSENGQAVSKTCKSGNDCCDKTEEGRVAGVNKATNIAEIAETEKSEEEEFEELLRIVDTLREFSYLDPKTHELTCDVYSRVKGSDLILVSLQSLARLVRFSAGNIFDRRLSPRLCHFLKTLLTTRACCNNSLCSSAPETQNYPPLYFVTDGSQSVESTLDVETHVEVPLPSATITENSAATITENSAATITENLTPAPSPTTGNGKGNAATDLSSADGKPPKSCQKSDVSNITVKIISKNLSDFFGRSFRLVVVPKCHGAECQSCPTLKLDEKEIRCVTEKYIEQVMGKFASTGDGELLLSACLTLQKVLEVDNDQQTMEALFTKHLISPIETVPSNSLNSLRECQKLSVWLRSRIPHAVSNRHCLDNCLQAPSVNWEDLSQSFELACRSRFPRCAFWKPNEAPLIETKPPGQ